MPNLKGQRRDVIRATQTKIKGRFGSTPKNQARATAPKKAAAKAANNRPVQNQNPAKKQKKSWW